MFYLWGVRIASYLLFIAVCIGIGLLVTSTRRYAKVDKETEC